VIDIDVDTRAAERFLGDIFDRVDQPRPLLQLLAGELRAYEEEVFATAGFGTWAALDPSTVRAKGSSRILVDTAGLLDSLTKPGAERITEESVTLLSDSPAAAYLKRGARGMPKRDPAPVPPASKVSEWAQDLLGYLVNGAGA